MGTWGPAIFDNDTALDIKGTFEDAIGEGLDVEAATRRVFEEYRDAFEDYEEAGLSWFALASLQMEHGALQPEVREKAIRQIDEGNDLRLWEESGNVDGAAQRRRVLLDLKSKLSATG